MSIMHEVFAKVHIYLLDVFRIPRGAVYCDIDRMWTL